MVWWWMYNPQFGIFNVLLKLVGLPDQPWLMSSHMALTSIIIFSVWKNLGYNMIIYLAGLQAIPPQFYEAATIDGAGASEALPAHHDPAPGAHHHLHPDLRYHPGLPGLRPGLRPDERAARPAPPTSSSWTSTGRPSSGTTSAMPRPRRWCSSCSSWASQCCSTSTASASRSPTDDVGARRSVPSGRLRYLVVGRRRRRAHDPAVLLDDHHRLEPAPDILAFPPKWIPTALTLEHFVVAFAKAPWLPTTGTASSSRSSRWAARSSSACSLATRSPSIASPSRTSSSSSS